MWIWEPAKFVWASDVDNTPISSTAIKNTRRILPQRVDGKGQCDDCNQSQNPNPLNHFARSEYKV